MSEETQPLLTTFENGPVEPELSTESTNTNIDLAYFDKLESSVWYKRPDVFHLLPWIFLVTVEMSVFAPLTINQLLGLICRQTYNQPLMFDSDKCQTSAIDVRLSQLLGWSNLIGGVAGLYIGPRLCAKSDQTGRVFWFLVAHGSIVLGLLTNVVAYQLWDKIDYHWLLVGCVLEGFAQPAVILTLISAYISDCTRPNERSKKLSWTFGTFTLGGTIGPGLGAALQRATDSIVIPYYLIISSITLSTVLMYFLLPESLNPQLKEIAISKKLVREPRSIFTEINFLAPLKGIWTISKESSRPRNVILLVLIDIMYIIPTAGLASVIVIYFQHVFRFTVTDIGLVLSGMALVQSLSLLIVPPLIAKFAPTNTSNSQQHIESTDITIIRICCIIETLSVLFFGLASSSQSAVISVLILSVGVVSRPTIWSANLAIIPSHEIGQFMGARSLLENILAVICSTGFTMIYSVTVESSPSMVFFIGAAIYTMSVVFSLFLSP